MLSGVMENEAGDSQNASFFGLNHHVDDNAKYLDELVRDMLHLNQVQQANPSVAFRHAALLLSSEIDRVWNLLYVQPSPQSQSPQSASPQSASPQSLSISPIRRAPTTPSPLFTSTPMVNSIPTSYRTSSPNAADVRQQLQDILLNNSFPVGATESNVPMHTLYEKIPIPENPSSRCNFIGRILGPRGISVKQLESETDCHILIRGQGSVKDARREARLRNQPGWEHLNDELHVYISASDANRERCAEKLGLGVEAIKRLLTPSNDEHKRRQLVQLAIINGTYRSSDDSH